MAGLHFRKLDLHTHTPASRCYLDKTQTAGEIIEAALAKGLNGIAVTDHNTAEWIDVMKKAAENTDMVIFPGVELSLEQGHKTRRIRQIRNDLYKECI
jgi:predicted metal-dependent phosphoesterase TrpH